ncbi:putative Calmodulin [Hypsibius exemplaris]|uniref:Calmodulin n=1 Tax=Hypsibius exemplaris TaxID=2072580 RepID=A0A1W0WVJ0_HYPEX|nr:putative Calmodulin [Hypsibius exemplaris]
MTDQLTDKQIDEYRQAFALADKQIDEYRQAFALADKDGNGSISVADLGSFMRSLGVSLTDYNLQDMINDVDIDGNGSIEFPEFLRMMVRKMKLTDEDEELRIAFQFLDRDKDGFLNAKELLIISAALGEKLTEMEASELIRESDVDGDGMINFQEFIHMMA